MATKDKVKYSRKWRMERRQNRRFEIFGIQYLLLKYPAIHAEIGLFYGKLNNKYPNKNNLTKTLEFKVWKTDLEMATTTPTCGQGQGTSTTTTTTPAVGQGQGTSTTTTTTPAVGQGQGTSTTTTTPAVGQGQGQGTSTTTTAVIAEGQATGHDLDIEGPSSLYDLGVEDPPMYDLDIDSMDNIITDIIAEMNQDDELRSIMDNFSY